MRLNNILVATLSHFQLKTKEFRIHCFKFGLCEHNTVLDLFNVDLAAAGVLADDGCIGNDQRAGVIVGGHIDRNVGLACRGHTPPH